MTRSPRTAHTGELASAVAFRMETHGIMAMPVLGDDDPIDEDFEDDNCDGGDGVVEGKLIA
jgi:CBS domain-containing protein